MNPDCSRVKIATAEWKSVLEAENERNQSDGPRIITEQRVCIRGWGRIGCTCVTHPWAAEAPRRGHGGHQSLTWSDNNPGRRDGTGWDLKPVPEEWEALLSQFRIQLYKLFVFQQRSNGLLLKVCEVCWLWWRCAPRPVSLVQEGSPRGVRWASSFSL